MREGAQIKASAQSRPVRYLVASPDAVSAILCLLKVLTLRADIAKRGAALSVLSEHLRC